MSIVTNFLKDLAGSAKSKRVIAATLTAFFLASAKELNIDQSTAFVIAGLVVSVILGDSFRPVNPDKLDASNPL